MKKKQKHKPYKIECPICHSMFDVVGFMDHHATEHTDDEWGVHEQKAREHLASVIYVDAGALLPVALQREMSDPQNIRYHDAGCDCDACTIKRGRK